MSLHRQEKAPSLTRAGSPPAQAPLKSGPASSGEGLSGSPVCPPPAAPPTASCQGPSVPDYRSSRRFELLTLPVLSTAEPGWNFPKRRR